jgi:hypothetical protein
MAPEKQRAAPRRNVKKAQAGAQSKQTLKHLSPQTRHDLGVEADKVRTGEAATGKDLEARARKPDIKGRSEMGEDELRRVIARER